MQQKHNDIIFYTIAIVAVTIATRLIAHHVLPVYDDAFITFRYARNLASGIGFVYNPGEWVLGLSTPAFGLLTSLFFLIHLPMPDSVVMLNILLDGIIVFVSFNYIARKIDIIPAILFGLLFAVSPILVRICVGGMEENLFLVLSIISMFCFSNGQTKISISLATLSFFFRPEGVLMVMILIVLILKERGIKEAAMMAFLSISSLILPFLVLYTTYGSILPQSIAAKSDLVRQPILSTILKLFFPDPAAIVLFPLAIWGMFKTFGTNKLLTLLALWIIIYSGAYLFARPFVWSWYSEPIHFSFAVFGGFGILDILKRIPKLNKIRPTVLAMSGITAALGIWIFVFAKVGEGAVTKNVYAKVEEWGNQLPNPNQTTILAGDIGVIGYYSRANVIDAAGLITPGAQNAKNIFTLIAKYHPDYLFLNATHDLVSTNDSLKNLYKPIARFAKSGTTSIVIDSSLFPNDWVQDYLLFKTKFF